MTFDMFLVIMCVFIFLIPVLMINKFLYAFERAMIFVSSFTKQDFKSYCSLEVPLDENSIVRKDGALVTFLKLKGTKSVVGRDEYIKISDRLQEMFASQMTTSGHDIQIVFRQDDEGSAKIVENAYSLTRASCIRMQLEVDDLLDSDIDSLSKVVSNEECWLILTTVPAKLNAEVLKDQAVAIAQHLKDEKLPPVGLAQNPAKMISALSTPHEGFVTMVREVFNECGVRIEMADCHEAIAAIRSEVDPWMNPSWKPSLPGDRMPCDVSRGLNVDDWSDLFYPAIWSQIHKNDMELISGVDERVKIGERYYATISISLPPRTPESFGILLERLKRAEIPFRFSFRIFANGLEMYQFNKTMVGFLSMFPKSYNSRIKASLDFLEENGKDYNDPALGLALVLTTWADDEKTISRRAQNASRILQGWGTCDVSTRSGDAMDMFASTLPGYSMNTASKVMLFPSTQVAGMLPIERPSSIWDQGSVLFTSIDGKLMPFQPGSSNQNTWVSLIFAPPGKGKSVLLNTLQLACCIAPGVRRLPLITVIDVGESVSGLISLLESGLKADKKHEVGYFKLQMKPEYSVNILDTQLGFRRPSPIERDFAVAFLSMLATPTGRLKAYDSTYEMIGLTIDEMYRRFSDKESPKKYEKGVDSIVDEQLGIINYVFDTNTTWWEVTDELFKRGFPIEAGRAQRYAVPVISDLPAVLNSPQVLDIYGKIEVGETKEKLPDLISRMIASALREYRIFGAPTQWDLSNCRVVGIDLNDVKGGGESGKKQTALMYAFAQNVAAKGYYLSAEMLREIPSYCPEQYRDFHKKRIDDIAEEIKTISYDEFHNTGGLEGIRRIVGVNIREGRKWNIQVFLASQLIDDFDSDMVENATSVYILAAENAITVEKCQRTFGLTDSMVHALERHVVKPGTFLAVYNTKQGKSVHVLKNTLSPVKYWSFTTTSEDKQIRRKLYAMMPGKDARALLATRFPGTSSSNTFKGYLEKRRLQMGMDTQSDEDGVSLIDSIAEEMHHDWLLAR